MPDQRSARTVAVASVRLLRWTAALGVGLNTGRSGSLVCRSTLSVSRSTGDRAHAAAGMVHVSQWPPCVWRTGVLDDTGIWALPWNSPWGVRMAGRPLDARSFALPAPRCTVSYTA